VPVAGQGARKHAGECNPSRPTPTHGASSDRILVSPPAVDHESSKALTHGFKRMHIFTSSLRGPHSVAVAPTRRRASISTHYRDPTRSPERVSPRLRQLAMHAMGLSARDGRGREGNL
jgi:hypothetical protein